MDNTILNKKIMDLITFKNKNYPYFQSIGNAAQFAIPYAKYFCDGIGYDIGCNRIEWSFPGSIPIDPVIDENYNATNLPNNEVDYIFSSHCLEHVETPWYDVLKYWTSKIKVGGTLFLYLPDYSQEYWRPWNNEKHKHIFTPEIMKDAFESLGFVEVFVSGVDLLNSFAIVGEKSAIR